MSNIIGIETMIDPKDGSEVRMCMRCHLPADFGMCNCTREQRKHHVEQTNEKIMVFKARLAGLTTAKRIIEHNGLTNT